MKDAKKTRKFDGKTYTLEDWFTHKTAAKARADTLRLRGYNVRITLRPKCEHPNGYPLSDLWYVWKRKSQTKKNKGSKEKWQLNAKQGT